MDYEKKYKEALEKARQLCAYPTTKPFISDLQDLFPELKEFENKRMIQYFKDLAPFDKADELYEKYGFSHKDAIAWLEKQGEQKPTDNEPKFHKGDWIVHHGTENIYQVVAVIDNQYQLKYGDTYTVQKCVDVDRCARLWDIAKDAKDGDVLATLDYILIFKKILSKDGGVSYCHYDFGSSTPQFNFNKDDNWYFGKEAKVYPATKGQRDTLFAKMKEAGYEWNEEKKELKKIEQKSAAWSEEDERMMMFCCDYLDDNQKSWLLSLKERYTWRPSEEQMKALEHFVRSIGESGYASPYDNDTKLLYSLLFDLKKLREE